MADQSIQPRQIEELGAPVPTCGGTDNKPVTHRGLTTVSNLVKLLPTSTVLAFQSLSPSFSNRGSCYASNKYLTSALIFLCSLSCVFFSFTDSVVGEDGKLYVGVATSKGFLVFNYDGPREGRERAVGDVRRLRIQPVDYVHAVLSALVFATLAVSESDVMRCFFPEERPEARQWLENLPLGVGFMASLVFMMFPTTRRGIGYSDLHCRTCNS